jgi:hypothetical protein
MLRLAAIGARCLRAEGVECFKPDAGLRPQSEAELRYVG